MATQTPSRPQPRKPGVAQGVTLILAAGLPVMGSVLLSPAVPKLLGTFEPQGINPYLIMTALVAPAACIGLVSPFLGPIVDRFGRRRALIGALTLYGLFGMAPLLLTNIYAIVATRFALGTTESVILAANLALLGDYFQGHQRTKWISTQSTALPIFGSLFFIFGGALAEISWQMPFAAYGLSFVILLLALLFLFDVSPSATELLTEDSPQPSDMTFVLICCLTIVSLMLFFIVPIQFAILLSANASMPSSLIGISMAITAAGNAIGAYSFRFFSKRSTSLLLGIAFVIGGVGLLIAATSTSVVGMTAAGVLNQLGCGIVVPALAWATLRVLPSAKRGAGSGRWWSCFYIGNFLSPMAVVFAVQSAGSVRVGFMWLSVVNLLFGVLVTASYLVSRTTLREHPRPTR